MSTSPSVPRRRKAIPWLIAAMPGYTVGFLAVVPFLYAAERFRTRKRRLVAWIYGAFSVTAWVLLVATPDTDIVDTVCSCFVVALAVTATAQAFVLRESLPGPADATSRHLSRPLPPPPVTAIVDATPAICVHIQEAVVSLRSYLALYGQAFSPPCTKLLNEIIADLDELTAFVANSARPAIELYSVEAMLTDYLPTSLNTFVRLPRAFSLTERNPDGRTAAEELEMQLRLLRNSTRNTADSLYRGNALRLQEQSAFLQSKLGGSELDLT